MKALTARELEVARLVGYGRSNRAIADTLGLAECTVKNHIARAFKKLTVQNRTQLALRIQNTLVIVSSVTRT
jgi:DNA-binding NarL/FixJ family response regulator